MPREDYYPSPPYKLRDGEYVVFEHLSPYMSLASHPVEAIRDHALFMLDMWNKYEEPRRWRRKWYWVPQPSGRVQRLRLSGVHRAGGWAVTLWVIARLLRH